MTVSRFIIALPLIAFVLAGCGPPSKLDSYSDQALRVCGKDHVAYVNVQEGRYGCQGGAFSHDH